MSLWGQQRNKGDEAAETVREGEMPLKIYLPTHPEARLTPAEREQLIAGLAATFSAEGGGHSGDRADD